MRKDGKGRREKGRLQEGMDKEWGDQRRGRRDESFEATTKGRRTL